MIGRPEWFRRRKYGGWGVFPKTWQGWVYLAVIVGGLMAIQAIPWPGEWTATLVMAAWALLFCVDTIHIMVALPRLDERERVHEAVAERNAMWVMVLALAAGFAYRTAQASAAGETYVDPVILIALGAGLATKAISNIYLDRRD